MLSLKFFNNETPLKKAVHATIQCTRSGNSCTHMASPASMEQKPHQPAANFSIDRKCESHFLSIIFQRNFGKQDVNKSFQQGWFARWSWPHYSETDDAAFSFIGTKAD